MLKGSFVIVYFVICQIRIFIVDEFLVLFNNAPTKVYLFAYLLQLI